MKLEINEEIKENLRSKYGDIIDFVEVNELNSHNDFINKFKVSLSLNYIFKSYTDLPNEYGIISAIDKFCNYMDAIMINRKPNWKLGGFDIYINNNIPDNAFYMSPSTYCELQEILYALDGDDDD